MGIPENGLALNSAQLSSTQLNSAQLSSTQLNSAQLSSTQLNSARLLVSLAGLEGVDVAGGVWWQGRGAEIAMRVLRSLKQWQPYGECRSLPFCGCDAHVAIMRGH